VLVALIHSVLGERYILVRLFRRDLPKLFGSDAFTRRTLRFAWHITSVMGVGLAAILVMLAAPGEAFALRTAEIVSATCALSGLVALAGSRGRHPAWVAFLAIAVLTWLGSH
jgi:hypothetical protein